MAGFDHKEIHVHPLTSDRWEDLEALFGPKGVNGCWCMWWRMKRAEFARCVGEQNRLAFKAIVDSGEVPGLLAYHNGLPVGWISVGPRKVYGSLERSRLFKSLDYRITWSVVCFYIRNGYRRKGLSGILLKEAIRYAAEQGAQVVEGYPVGPGQEKSADADLYTGVLSLFLRAGFAEAAQPSGRRVLMRYYITETRETNGLE